MFILIDLIIIDYFHMLFYASPQYLIYNVIIDQNVNNM